MLVRYLRSRYLGDTNCQTFFTRAPLECGDNEILVGISTAGADAVELFRWSANRCQEEVRPPSTLLLHDSGENYRPGSPPSTQVELLSQQEQGFAVSSSFTPLLYQRFAFRSRRRTPVRGSKKCNDVPQRLRQVTVCFTSVRASHYPPPRDPDF